jgi:hypothetical protein
LAEVAMVVGIMQTTLKYMEKINEWMLTNWTCKKKIVNGPVLLICLF